MPISLIFRRCNALLALAALGLPAVAAAQPEGSPAAAPERISYSGTGNGWGGGQTEWWIDRSGRGAYRTTIRKKLSGKFNVGPQGFERVRAILQPLEGVAELPCDGMVTDQGMGTLSWRRGRQDNALRFNFGCNFRQPDSARDRLGEASELVEQWALAKK
ncbi:MAG TPA: hypothetical protein VN047_15465 [Sphingopyxis sp.]|uniref:hypothetical protein n=1 Tax=Sphingopyxis sp. TaxID=1908224 RepID=UPI002B7E41F7|nr:hypothetical protein [Sphingopyxis sp.]HWW58291.1 hypothetical protein [Sphingopyxis sp.]